MYVEDGGAVVATNS